jgi:hypothetical protein
MQKQHPSLHRLSPLIGPWDVETSLAPPGSVRARTTFEWTLDGRFVLQRSEIEIPEAPDGLCLIAADAEGDGFTQHYFDSRGVVRLYAMTFADGTWTLERTAADFTPLSFEQRYVAELSDDGATITGRWETRPPGASAWEHDFDLTYRRA